MDLTTEQDIHLRIQCLAMANIEEFDTEHILERALEFFNFLTAEDPNEV